MLEDRYKKGRLWREGWRGNRFVPAVHCAHKNVHICRQFASQFMQLPHLLALGN